jgi:hypothetical protein
MPEEFEARGAKVSALAQELGRHFRNSRDARADLFDDVAKNSACLTVAMRTVEAAAGRIDIAQLPPLNQVFLNETAALLDEAVAALSAESGTGAPE